MLRTIAIIYGILFFLIGLLGFTQYFAAEGMLFGIFHVNGVHNIVHLLTGFIAIWVGSTSTEGSKFFFQLFGVIYALIALLGFGYGDKPVFGIIANNCEDAWLNLFIGGISLYLGFGLPLQLRHKNSEKQ